MTSYDDRFAAALAWCRLTPLERARIAERAKTDTPTIYGSEVPEWAVGPSVTMRVNRYAHDLAVKAWPDANVRKLRIAELTVIAAEKELEKREKARITQ